MMNRTTRIVDHTGKPIVVRANSAYESAGTGRRAAGWYAPGTGVNTLLGGALERLRNRSRAAYRNNPWIKNGIDRLVSNEIGTGITPRCRVDDSDFTDSVNALWAQSCKEIDADGQLDFYGLQSLLSRTRNAGSEVFIRRRMRRASSGLSVPIQIQALEAEFVPLNLTLRRPNGNTVRQGIERDRRGQRVAYWMYTEHPQDSAAAIDLGRLIRVRASDVIHHYLPIRPGQLRGEPVTAQALLKAYTYDSYDDAELVRKQTRAPYTGFISREYEGEADWDYDPLTGEPLRRDASDVPTADAEPGTFLSGLPGEKPILFDGDKTGEGYADFARQQLLGISAALAGIPYEVLSGDWKGVNDRLVRAILHEFRRAVEATQDQLMIYQVCRSVWHWWFDAAVMSSALNAPGYASRRSEYLKHEWRPQGWPYLHPEQDINAKVKAIDNDLTSLDAEVAKTGQDANEIQRQNAESERRKREYRRAAGLPEDSSEG